MCLKSTIALLLKNVKLETHITLKANQVSLQFSAASSHTFKLPIGDRKPVAYLVTSTENLIFVATTCSTLPGN